MAGEVTLHRSAIHRGTWTAVFGAGFDQSHMVDVCGPLRVVQAEVRRQFGDGVFLRTGPDGYEFRGVAD